MTVSVSADADAAARRICLVDLESGNLHSVSRALDAVAGGASVARGRDPGEVARATHIVIPGVGAFPALASRLRAADGLEDALADARARGVPILGICVGMQLLASVGREHGDTPGLDWIQGEVAPLPAPAAGLKVPHMGWSETRPAGDDAGGMLAKSEWFYFAHSFHFDARDRSAVAATFAWRGQDADSETPLVAAVADGAVWGVQFHPEKSARAGLEFLARFLALPSPSLSPSP
ncbi:MAG: imidazole glycerol phosphate synthase subunit HisH [Alphaproteobacteria bacterium]|nr:imidazole glycerol phosphate synthase subunit HisH [Alphaproteobacteria bacterium]MDA7983529.1 imidazole glycerol phosphate synthase subunit HisH [Alphaproteobacteria bacterium]MDA8008813.1 imidazole glycerol phosphate synthase subunit HisH [Alphaproteobacteria bacterium]